MAITSIRNETPSQLTLIGAENERLVLAPLQEKSISDVSAFDFEDAMREGIISLGEEAPSVLIEKIGGVIYGGVFAVWIVGLFLSGLEPLFNITPERWQVFAWALPAVILLGVVLVLFLRGTNSFSLVTRVAAQLTALTFILAIGVGLPAATIYYFGGGNELLLPISSDTSRLALFGRLIQLSFIGTASLLPVLLFFLFDRFQLGTLRMRLYTNLFRLDPSMHTRGEIDAKYGSHISEAYGSQHLGRGRLDPSSRWPVMVCAFVITISWIVALAPVGASFSPSDSEQVLKVLLPQPTALVFGFLGVYFFSLRLIAIRYARGDLKPKAYTHIMVRVFIVIVLSSVLDTTFKGDSPTKLVLAFLIGITPDEFFTWLKESFRGVLPSKIFPAPTKLPLSDLEGIDLYELGRLESEGIVNIEGLAHHELIDLIIDTRIPVPRLIDWVDQSILYLHLVGGSDNDSRAKLRDYGIRTATDLLRAWDQAKARGDAEFEGFRKLLGGERQPYRLEVIRDTLLDDEWMVTVSCWRKDAVHEPIQRSALPSSVEALERWADKQLEDQNYGRALNILQESLNIRDTATTRLRIAHIYANSRVAEYRDADKVREHAARASELAPNDHSVVSKLIEIYRDIEDYDNADRMCNDAIVIVSHWNDLEQKNKETERLQSLKKRINEDRVSTPRKLRQT